MARGIKLICVCACVWVCVCVIVCVRNENQQKAKALCLCEKGPHFLRPQDFIFISKESFKNDLLYNLDLFIHVPSTWVKYEGQYWLPKGKENGYPQNEKGGGGGWCSTCERENNGAISVGQCRYLNEHPITQAAVSLQQGTRVPN